MTIQLSPNFSLGFYREDGDFQVIATLNDSNETLYEGAALEIARDLRELVQARLNENHFHERVVILNREDTPNCVPIEDNAAEV